MAKRSRTYWIQLCYADDRPDEWLASVSGYNDTCITAGGLLIKRGAEFALILKPWVRKGACASKREILAEIETKDRPGAKLMQVTL